MLNHEVGTKSSIHIYRLHRFKNQLLTPSPPNLHTTTFHCRSRILNIPIQKPTPSTKHRLHKRLIDHIRARPARMRMIIREKAIHLGLPQRLEDIRGIRPMIHKHGILSNLLRHTLAVRSKSTRRIRETAAFPRVIRRWGRDDDFGAFGDECFSGVGEVGGIGEDSHGLAIVSGFAGLGTGTGASGASIVVGQRAPVVVPEFNDYDVVGLDGVDESLEAVFDGVGTGAAAADGFVGDGDGEGVGEVFAPACDELVWRLYGKRERSL